MALLAALLLLTYLTEGCTLVAIGSKATADGSAIVAHTDDAGGGTADLRLVKIPARDWPDGSTRPVYNFANGYPRVVTNDRGPHYQPIGNQKLFKPIGYIPQVAHTYAYFDQDYGLMNEVQLAIAETSCGARTIGWSIDVPYGKNLFSIAELSRIALERCDSARCAITTMGELASKHGFFDEDSGTPQYPGFSDSGETLAISDRYGEVWVFSICTGPDGSGAIWAAQRIPDDHIYVSANGFTIRQMNLSDPDNYLASPNIHSAAIELGWWNPREGPFDFTAAYAYTSGGPVMPYYLGRRTWRIFDLAAPSLKLNPYLGIVPSVPTYPFSVRPEKPITVTWVQNIFRDHFEGTEFDMTKGLSAGPFGNPVRYDGPGRNVTGGWERSISMYRTSFSFVCQSRPHLPNEIGGLFWYGHDNPHGTVYVPVYASQEGLPDCYLNCKQSVYSRECSWWAFNFVNNWINLRYDVMIQEVKAKYTALENEACDSVKQLEKKALDAYPDKKTIIEMLTTFSNKFASKVTKEWWELADLLIAKYSNGYIVTGELASEMKCPGYPASWLVATDFNGWPHHPQPEWITPYPSRAVPLPVIPDPSHPGSFLPSNAMDWSAVQRMIEEEAAAGRMTNIALFFMIVGMLVGGFGCLLLMKFFQRPIKETVDKRSRYEQI